MSRDGIVNLKGKDYPTWPYVLNTAHDRGLKGISCKLLQIPAEENGNVAIVCATAHFPEGDWTCYGDASPRNVNTVIATALIRMAETRAKGRALRDACNIGETMKEELADETAALSYANVAPANHTPTASSRPVPPAPAPASPPRQEARPSSAAPPAAGAIICQSEGCGVILTLGQHTVSQRVYGKSLCPRHQASAGEQLAKIASRPAA